LSFSRPTPSGRPLLPLLFRGEIAVEHRQVGVADAAGDDVVLDLSGEELPGFEVEAFETSSGLVGGAGSDLGGLLFGRRCRSSVARADACFGRGGQPV
jgi:hypothetical protein